MHTRIVHCRLSEKWQERLGKFAFKSAVASLRRQQDGNDSNNGDGKKLLDTWYQGNGALICGENPGKRKKTDNHCCPPCVLLSSSCLPLLTPHLFFHTHDRAPRRIRESSGFPSYYGGTWARGLESVSKVRCQSTGNRTSVGCRT